MVYYLHPYIENDTPIGGILKIFDHIEILNKNGIKAKAVYYTDEFILNPNLKLKDIIFIQLKWANKKIKSISITKLIKDIKLDDTIVIPEIRPFLVNFFPSVRNKIIFIQNWHKIIPKKFGLKKKHTYESIGYNYIITCSNFLTKYVKEEITDKKNGGNHKAGKIPIFTVNNSADTNIFYRNDKYRIPNRVIMLTRKGKNFIKKIIKNMKKANYTFHIIDKHISQKKLANEFRKSDIYIHTGYPEGFGLPVLEAQLCGAIVIGFTGGGASELMIHNKTSLIAKDGNIKQIIKYLNLLQYNNKLKEQLRNSGYKIALKHNVENEQKLLLNAFTQILKT